MLHQKRIRDYGIRVGHLLPGKRNAITDVEGITVGHATLQRADINTGVSALIPHTGNIFRENLAAAVHVINGFGKSLGLLQVEELGRLETPILLSNTFAVGTCFNYLVRYMTAHNAEIGRGGGTVNPLVFECNDSYLSDIRRMPVTEKDAEQALASAQKDFTEGAVGAGTGMSCYKLKGGIGTASRLISWGSSSHTVGMLILSNMGRLEDLSIAGKAIGKKIAEQNGSSNNTGDKGSLIMLIATDIPMSSRQLKRIAKRAVVGVSRTGNFIDSGSGEIALAFSTAQKIQRYSSELYLNRKFLHEEKIDLVFRAVAECAEEAVLNSMITAGKTTGIEGHVREPLSDYMSLFLARS